MAEFTILAATTQPFSTNAGLALRNLARAPAAASAEIPDDFAASRAPGGVPLDVAAGRAAVSRALTAGNAILDALQVLAGVFRLAADGGLVNPSANITQDGTRVSGVTITAQGGRLVAAIDELVASAATGAANLIASGASRVTIQTTQFGGRITVGAQPLDSLGLGIQDLSAIGRDEALASLNRIEAAITLARTRLDNLGALADGLAPGGRLTNDVARLLAVGNQGFLPRGSLVNQIA